MITSDQIRAIIEARRESDLPDEVLTVLHSIEGKPLTVRILSKLPGGEARWCINHSAGMTYLEERDYRRSGGERGMSLLISYEVKNVVVDCAEIERRNPSYFAARRERNHERLIAENDAELCERLATRILAVRLAREVLEEAEEKLDELTHTGPFNADRGVWDSLALNEKTAKILFEAHGIK